MIFQTEWHLVERDSRNFIVDSPNGCGFVWIWRCGESHLAYWDGRGFQLPETVGDREGLRML